MLSLFARMGRSARIFGWTLVVLAGVLLAATLHFYLPRHEVVHLTGTDVTRMDKVAKDKSVDVRHTRDVRFVTAVSVDDPESVRVWRNEDTGWGWPFYFKFDSGTIVSQTNNILEKSSGSPVLVTTYGWRIEMLSWFPNIVGMRIVEPGYTYFPAFTIVITTLVFGAFGVLVFLVRRGFQRAVAALDQASVGDSIVDAVERAEAVVEESWNSVRDTVREATGAGQPPKRQGPAPTVDAKGFFDSRK